MLRSLPRATTSLRRKAVLASTSSPLLFGARAITKLPTPSLLPRRLASSIVSPRSSSVILCRHHVKCVSPSSINTSPLWSANTSLRCFHTESDYHTAANETLEDIQDAVEEALEDKGIPDFEVTFASGVLTMVFPPRGTWVLNKQTPNQQIWWSSPISGPRRYEYEEGEWVYTRDDSHSMTLTQALQEEIQQIYDVEIDLQ